jgi:hypothetical protein
MHAHHAARPSGIRDDNASPNRRGEPGRRRRGGRARTDKVDTLLQAIEYQAQGYDTAGWRESSTTALRTNSAQEFAQAISSADPHEWWSAFAASYRELRATSRGSKSS